MEFEFKQYRRKQIAELADWAPGMDLTGVSISGADAKNGSPLLGDKIARSSGNHDDRWLVAADYFAANFEEVVGTEIERKSEAPDCPKCGGLMHEGFDPVSSKPMWVCFADYSQIAMGE